MSIRMDKKDKRQKVRAGLARRLRDNQGTSLLELALLLPMLVILAFGVIDFGRLIHARLVVTNVSREGGSMASRDMLSDPNLINMLMTSANPLDLQNNGRVYVYKIKAGTSSAKPKPWIYHKRVAGSYTAASSSITGEEGDIPTGLPTSLYNHLVYDDTQKTSDLSEISVVEVFYFYKPITPLPGFITMSASGIPIGCKSIF
jgi:hypothetical protein